MAFLLLQTATMANDAYVTLNRGRRFVHALFPFWSSRMQKSYNNIDQLISKAYLSPTLSLE